jgi:RNA polymerase I-specific transcription initiation factor RRN7
LLPDPPPAEPYLHAQENQDGDEGIADARPQESLDSGKEPQENDEDLENELELEALMQENSDILDSSDEEDDDLVPAGVDKPSKSKGRFAYESPASTIAVLVVGCWTLRIPVMYRDFSRYVV